MFQRLLIAAALATGAPLIGAIVAPDAGIGQAQAQFKSTRIKNVRIKKKKVGGNFKIVARTDSDGAATVAGGSVAIRTAEGELLDTLTLRDAGRARVDATLPDGGALLGLVEGRTIDIEVVDTNGEGGEIVDVIPDVLLAASAGRLRGEGVSANGYKARVRVDRAGALRVVVLNEDGGWIGDLRGVTASAEGAEPMALTLDGVRQRRVATTDVDLEATGPVQVQTTLVDAEGAVLDARTETVSVVDDLETPEILSIKAKATRDGRAKLVTITRSTGDDTRLTVGLTDRESGEVALDATDDSPVSTVRSFFGSVEFEDDPTGSVYLCLVDLLDSAGDPTGEQYEFEVVVPEHVAGEATSTAYPIGDGLGELRMWRDDAGHHFSIGLRGSPEVAAANVIFEEPFEGPQPRDTEVLLDFQAQYEKWIQKGDGALPEQFEVTTIMSAQGAVVGAVEGATGSPDGGAVFSNGFGTRKASAQATQNQASQIALL